MSSDKQPKRLTIHYKEGLAINPKTETFKTSNPDRIINRRNAPNIDKVFYDGKPFDISKHVKLYPEPKRHEKL
jgi:hypothetical protein